MDAVGRFVYCLGYYIFVLSSGYPIGKIITLIGWLLTFLK